MRSTFTGDKVYNGYESDANETTVYLAIIVLSENKVSSNAAAHTRWETLLGNQMTV